MSKLSNAVKVMKENNELRLDETVVNFMGGNSYKINPLDTLKMITASSIFGEPSYYVNSRGRSRYVEHSLVTDTIMPDEYKGMKTEDIMEQAIDAALDYDFGETILWAKQLRKEFNMRLNPQVIMVRAAVHPKRAEFTKLNPGMFNDINKAVMSRPDEPLTQMAYFLYNNGGKKNNIPSIIKRSWAEKISNLNRYNVSKYKNHEIGMINGVRLCHASSDIIDELMTTGSVEVDTEQATWENLKSAGKSWKEILEVIDLGHMARLRNLRGVFEEIDDIEICKDYLTKLKDGVVNGKQFPFRYFSAMEAVRSSSRCNHRSMIIDALEECIDISMSNMPKLKGKTMCLSDNSGSAWGAFTSEYGSMNIARIDNLSSVITAACSDDGYVGKFGDRLVTYPISKRQGVLKQAEDITNKGMSEVGGGTEGGIWEFFKSAINNKEHWDNIFIYSDMQAGHGGLYGTYSQTAEYRDAGFSSGGHINVYKLIQEYRKKVNPKVNVFCIQTAGYDNVLIPELAYRTSIQYGWTGKESIFAAEYIRQWDEIENKKK